MRRGVIIAAFAAFLPSLYPVTPAVSAVPPPPPLCIPPPFPEPDPCVMTTLPFVGTYQGGEQAGIYLMNWWNTEFYPALQRMTAQWYAARVDQSRQIGALIDAQSVTRVARLEQEQQLRSKQTNLPSEMVCTAGSYSAALSETLRTGNALAKGFRLDLFERATGAPGSSSEKGIASDQLIRWDRYCAEFHDPNNNNGMGFAGNCPNPLTPGPVVNADIDIEGFLLKDTINMSDPDEYAASLAILENLVQPIIRERIPDDTVDSPTGQERIIRRQHLESISNITSNTVASILSRRASIPASFALPPLLRDIRLKAGIDPTQVANNPSYNEIMLAMTKERFLNPEYFFRIHDDPGAIKQEQTSVNAYITLQMEDIYKMQEQINLLLAARAALKFEADMKSNRTSGAPLSQ